MSAISVRAPIDGVVHRIANVGFQASPGVSPALKKFEQRRANRKPHPIESEYSLSGLPDVGDVLFKVHSDILQLQLLEEEQKLEIAEQKLKRLKEQRDLEIGTAKSKGISQLEPPRECRRLRWLSQAAMA
jgi:hypothetical protein